MARLTCFVETFSDHGSEAPLGEIAARWVEHLLEGQHDLQVITSYSARDSLERLPSHARLETLAPLKSWSWLELPSLIPLLSRFRPDIAVAISPFRSQAARIWDVRPALFPFLSGPLGARTAAYLLDVGPRLITGPVERLFLQTCQLILTASPAQADLISSAVRADGPSIQAVGLPEMAFSGADAPWVKNLFEEYIYIPGAVSQHAAFDLVLNVLAPLLAAQPRVGAIVSGGWGETSARQRQEWSRRIRELDIHDRLVVPEELTEACKEDLVRGSRVFLAATLQSSSLRLTLELQHARRWGIRPVLTAAQARMSGVFVAPDSYLPVVLTSASLHSALADEIGRRRTWASRSDFSVSDAHANAVNRAFADVLRGR